MHLKCIWGKYNKRVGFNKENTYYLLKHQKKDLPWFAIKLIEKIPDPSNINEYYQSYLKNKIAKTIKNNLSTTRNFRKPKHCWRKISHYIRHKNFS